MMTDKAITSLTTELLLLHLNIFENLKWESDAHFMKQKYLT